MAQADKLAWLAVDVASDLSPELQAKWQAIETAKAEFERAMADTVQGPTGTEMVFAYRRGLAIAFAPLRRSRATFAELMAKATPQFTLIKKA